MCTKKKQTFKQATKELNEGAMCMKAISTHKKKFETEINKPKL